MSPRFRPAGAALALLLLTSCGAPPQPESRPLAPPTATPSAHGRKDLPPEAFKVEWQAVGLPAQMHPGQEIEADVTLKNASTVAWPGGAGTTGLVYTVRLGHRWLQDGRVVRDYGDTRTELPVEVAPGEAVTVRPRFTAPGTPGRYQLQLDLVHEGVNWFEALGAGRKLVEVEVRG